MRVEETLRKPMAEAKYLNVENTDRYRPIMRLFYLNYEKLQYWMYQEEVYEQLREDPWFREYTPEQCQLDLAKLVEWGNLATIQDTRRVTTIEEFRNRKFRYQLTEVSVEIERMVIRVENLLVETSSLEPSLLERIRINLGRIPDMPDEEAERRYTWWNDLNNDFIRLNQNYQDYMRELNSVRAEEMMQTKEFLVFKDRLIEYLRNFVKSLQENVTVIEQYLRKLDQNLIRTVLDQVTEYELSIPRIDTEVDERQIYDKIQGRWDNLCKWFAGESDRPSEAAQVFETTNEIIRRITRYAARISELSSTGANRREEYRKAASMFAKCADLQEAHRLAAVIFGIEKPMHLAGLGARETDSINSGVYEEPPAEAVIRPRVRTYRERSERSEIVDHTREKAAKREEEIRRMEKEQLLLNSYIRNGCLRFAELPEIEPNVRDTFLLWLSRALENKSGRGKTEDGRIFHLENAGTRETCLLKARDGTFRMPAFVIRFEETV